MQGRVIGYRYVSDRRAFNGVMEVVAMKKGLELSIHTITLLVVFIVVMSVSLTVTGNTTDDLNRMGERDVIKSSSVTACNIKCFKCCSYFGDENDVCGTSQDERFRTVGCVCRCNPEGS